MPDAGWISSSGKIIPIVLGLLFLSADPVFSENSGGPAVPLSLARAVKIAVTHNIDLHVAREDIRLQQSAVLREAGRFDPTLSFDLRTDRTVRSSTSLIETGPSGTDRIVQENQRFNASLKQRLLTGGDFGLSFRQFRSEASFQAVNPTLNGDLVFSFTQPLLQGKGREVTEGPLRIANTDIAI
ncbi:MAG: hypothetical protein ACE5F7_11640, partial [Nitrospiria bacterium]